MTSGYVDPFSSENSHCLRNNSKLYSQYLYSNETYAIGSQQSISFCLGFANYSSGQSHDYPPIKYLGYAIYCHYMTYHDMNMMVKYFVYNNYLI